MKILVLTNLYPPDFLGGYELGCRQAVDALRGAGHTVLVLTGNPRVPTPRESHVSRRLGLNDVYDPYVHHSARPAALAERHLSAHGIDAANVHTLLETIEDFQPDVVYFWNLVGIGGLGLIAATQMVGTPWVQHIMDQVPNVLCFIPANRQTDLLRLFGKYAKGTFLCCSKTVMKEIVDAGAPITCRSRVIPNWVTTVRESDRPASDFLPGGKLRIVTAGSISVNKGIDILIDAAAILRSRGHSNFIVDIYGQANDPFFLARILEKDLSSHVRLRGVRTQAELAELYTEYDVFAFPTWAREPFGFAPMEAGAQGCLMAISSLCGIAEWFVGGMNCVKAERSAEAFANVFEEILAGGVPIAEIANRGLRTIRKEYRLDTILPAIEAELDRAMEEWDVDPVPTEDIYRTAILAERMFRVILQENVAC